MATKKTALTAPAFSYEVDTEVTAVPAIARAQGPANTYPFPALKIGQSFTIPVEVPESITEAGERVQASKEAGRKVSNRLTGAVRKYKNANEGTEFAVRTIAGDDKLVTAIRCWRIEVNKAA